MKPMNFSLRLIALLLAVITLAALLPACEQPEEPSSEASASEVSSEPVSEQPSEPAEDPLPSASTLVGTVHMPPIGNQGGIGSCTSYGVTYMQFNIAVSQYLHSINPNTRWNPSSGEDRYIFSPKYSYVFAGPSTESCYNVLTDHGCLTKQQTYFAGPYSPILYEGGSFASGSTCWDVGEGDMESALTYRLTGFEEIEMSEMQLTSSPVINKIKEAIAAGNGVAMCGWSGNWEYASIDKGGLGELGKRSDRVIFAARNVTDYYDNGSDMSGNHCTCLVGYDDNITCTVGGVTLKGAFQMANSWSEGWMNDGLVWIMYDAFNTKSEFDELNGDYFYTDAQALTIEEDHLRLYKGMESKVDQRLLFNALDQTCTVNGKEYKLYTISDLAEKSFLAYSKDANGLYPVVSSSGQEAGSCRFALIPYEDVKGWSGIRSGNLKDDDYKGSFLLYAADSGIAENGAAYLSGTAYTRAGREAEFDGPDKGNNLSEILFTITGYSAEGASFRGRAYQVGTVTRTCKRTSVGYRFSFVYWDKNVAVGKPGAMIEIELENYKREGIKIVASRTDAAGNTCSKIPAVFGENAGNVNSLFSDKSMTFGGQIADKDSTYEHAFITVGYNELADLMEGYSIDNFLWSFTYKSLGTRLLSISLKDGEGNVLQKVVPTEKNKILDKGEEVAFLFDLGGELREYSASPEGDRRIISERDGKYLTVKTMTFTMGDDPVEKTTAFSLTKNSETGAAQIFQYKTNYLFDISGKEIKDGVQVKLNAPSAKRSTQDWGIRDMGSGKYQIYLAADPTYVLCNDPEKGVCLTNVNTDDVACLWHFEATDSGVSTTVKAEQKDGKLHITGRMPEKDGTVTVQLCDGATGEVVATAPVTVGAGFETELDAPAPGTYLLSALRDGQPYGVQYIFTVK